MPVQINEVIIRTVVDSSKDEKSAPPDTESQSMTDTALLELVMETLNEESER